MTRELEAELAALSKAEKAEVVERLAQDIAGTWPGIEKTVVAARRGLDAAVRDVGLLGGVQVRVNRARAACVPFSIPNSSAM